MAVSRIISNEGLNPIKLINKGINGVELSGFYYYLASLQEYVGVSDYNVTRFGAPLLSGLVSMITYLIINRLENKYVGLLASVFLFVNPFFVRRFSMTLRENFAFTIMLVVILILVINKDDQKTNFDPFFSFITGLLMSTIFISHSLTPVLIYGVIGIEIMNNVFLNNKMQVYNLSFSIIISFLFSFPYLNTTLLIFKWIISNHIEYNLILYVFGFFSVLMMTFYYLNKKQITLIEIIRIIYNRKIFISLYYVLLMGGLYSILISKDFQILGTYNPNIVMANFSKSLLPLSIFGLISNVWNPVDRYFGALSVIVLIILNLTNINIAFPLFRMIIYITWISTYLGIKGIVEFLKIFDEDFNTKIIKLNLPLFSKNIKIKLSVLIVFILSLTLTPFIYKDYQSINGHYSYYSVEDVTSTYSFVNVINDEDIIIPQGWSNGVLLYAGIEPIQLVNGYNLQQLYEIDSIELFSDIILENYPNKTRALIVGRERFIDRDGYPFPQIGFMETYGEITRIGSIIYYEIKLN